MSEIKVDVQDAGPCRKTLRIEVPAALAARTREEVVQEFVQRMRLPGFRPGHVPRPVVEKRYASSIADSVRDRIGSRFYREALAETKLAPLAVVGTSRVETAADGAARFEVTLDVPPAFVLPSYEGIPVERREVKVADEDVAGAIDRMRERLARYEDAASRPVADGDLVRIDYAGTCEGRPVAGFEGAAGPLAEGKGFWMVVGEREPVPGLREGLRGAATGETREIRVRFPADFHVAALAGREAVYRATVGALRERKLPAVDADFLAKAGVETEEALRARVRSELTAVAEGAERERVRRAVAQHLLEKTAMDIPQTVMEQETQTTIRSLVRNIAGQGATREQIQQQRERIMAAAQESTRDRVRLSYILSRIAAERAIEVGEEDVEARITEMAGAYGMTPEHLSAEIEKRHGMDSLWSDLREERTLDWLAARVVPKS